MFMRESWRKIGFSDINVVLAAEFFVDRLSFLFSSNKTRIRELGRFRLLRQLWQALFLCFCEFAELLRR